MIRAGGHVIRNGKWIPEALVSQDGQNRKPSRAPRADRKRTTRSRTRAERSQQHAQPEPVSLDTDPQPEEP